MRYESLKLRFFPQPYVEARNATVRIPGTLDGRIGALEIRIALLPLLAGRVRPVEVNVARPELEVEIEPGGGGADPFAAYRAAAGPVVDALVREARGLSLGITDGKLDVLYAGQRILSLSGLAADAQVAAEAITASASSAANLWRTANADLKITRARSPRRGSCRCPRCGCRSSFGPPARRASCTSAQGRSTPSSTRERTGARACAERSPRRRRG